MSLFSNKIVSHSGVVHDIQMQTKNALRYVFVIKRTRVESVKSYVYTIVIIYIRASWIIHFNNRYVP